LPRCGSFFFFVLNFWHGHDLWGGGKNCGVVFFIWQTPHRNLSK